MAFFSFKTWAVDFKWKKRAASIQVENHFLFVTTVLWKHELHWEATDKMSELWQTLKNSTANSHNLQNKSQVDENEVSESLLIHIFWQTLASLHLLHL